MRMIDADALIDALSIFNDKENGNAHFLNGIETAKEIITAAPTIAAEDVRRGMCIDCIMHDESTVEAEQVRNALMLMVLQYCTDDDGYLWNRFMSAGEAAFKVLGVTNGDSADELWAKLEGEEKDETD